MAILTTTNKYLFDTSVFIEILRNRKPAITLNREKRFAQIFVGYSIITETELWQGMVGSRTIAQHTALLRLYHRYPINVTIARNAGLYWRDFYQNGLRGRNLPPMADCLIAATAKFHDLRLVSSDKHCELFQQFGVMVDKYEQE